MKNLQKAVLALVATSMVSMGAQAAVTYGNGMTAQPYVGAKVGQYDLDQAKDSATSYGIYGGAKFTPNFGVEAEYLTTSTEDFIQTTANKSEYDADVYGLYATYDYAFPSMSGLYAKGRLGFAKNEVNVAAVSGNASDKASESGIAGGIGLGYSMSPNLAVEVAYDWYPTISTTSGADLDANGITLGANFKF